jgi:hypothetical protein
MIKYRLTTFTFHDFIQKCVKRARGMGGQFGMSGRGGGGATGGPGAKWSPVYMLTEICVAVT